MKKLLCALLALAMLCACAVAETVDVTGTWYLTKSYNEKFDLDCVQMGLDATLTLQPDGTVDMDAQWEFMSRIWEDEVGPDETTDEEPPAEIRWKMDGDKVILTYENNETRELTLVDGNLVEIEEELGTTDVYTREKPVLNYFDPGAPLTDVTLEDFDGTWNAAIVNFAGVDLTAEELSLEMTVELSGGSGTITDSSAVLREPQIYTVTGELADGVLTVTEEVAETDTPAVITLTLCDSGVMVYFDGSNTIYFERAEAGAEE